MGLFNDNQDLFDVDHCVNKTGRTDWVVAKFILSSNNPMLT